MARYWQSSTFSGFFVEGNRQDRTLTEQLSEALEGEERERLLSYHREKLSAENAAWIKSKMKEHKSVERSYALAQKLSDKAIAAVAGDDRLVGIIESMMKRSF